MLKRFDPPGFLPDLARVPGMVDEWSAAVSYWFDSSVESGRSKRHLGNGHVGFAFVSRGTQEYKVTYRLSFAPLRSFQSLGSQRVSPLVAGPSL
jgi:hypothetical protein